MYGLSLSPTIPTALRESVADADRLRTRAIDRYSYAGDASHYLHVPEAVVIAQDAAEVAAILRFCRDEGGNIVPRGAGEGKRIKRGSRKAGSLSFSSDNRKDITRRSRGSRRRHSLSGHRPG